MKKIETSITNDIPKPRRKAVSLVQYKDSVMALCDDGTMWCYCWEDGWQALYEEIPQD